LYGAKENEIIGKTDYDFVEKELADFFRKNDLKAIAAGKPSMNEEELTYADGHSEFVETIKTPMFDITGKLIGVLGVARDISERKKMEHALQENAERFIRWQESNFIGILHGRANGEIIEANNTLLNMLGYSRQDLLDKGLKWTKLTPNEFSYLHGVAIKEAEEKGYWSPFEIEYFHKSGHRVPVLVGGSVFQESSDQFIVFIIDLTERKQQEEKLRHSQKMDALGKMTGGIAHDYNNMLGVILGYADLLKTSLSEQPVQARYAHEIHRAGERGAKLTKKLLAFSRQNCSDTERLDINSLLCNEKHMLEKILTVRIRLVFDLENKLWPVWLDSSYMEDTIINMSINAMHAMEGTGQLTFKTRNETLSGSDAKELRLNAGDYVTLSITDTGSGMSEEVKQKIFDPFYSTKGESGTGLGLSQVYGFIEHSNGAIKVNSEPGKGAQFVLYFPRYIESDLEKQVEKNHYLADSNNNVKANGKILVVDDEPALLELTSEILRQHELNVLSAKSAKIALDILEYESIDILLSDVIMPEMDGYQLAAIVKEKYPAIKIQLVSGFTGGRNDDLLDDSLLNNLLSKPFNSKTLLKRIDELLNEK
jgi:PAS domain S-box-containing protein